MAEQPDFTDVAALNQKYGGKMGIDTGPVPLRRWMPQPTVQVKAAPQGQAEQPNGGAMRKQTLRPEVKRGKGK